MKFKNTLCPYSQVALKRCANVNQEHILGSALGGPDGLVIRCEEAQNLRQENEPTSKVVGRCWWLCGLCLGQSGALF